MCLIHRDSSGAVVRLSLCQDDHSPGGSHGHVSIGGFLYNPGEQ